MDKLIGQTLDRYKIQAKIGEGGMGAVYRARDITLQREVAVKVMNPQYASRRSFQERFLQEARSAARIDHPGVVKVYDFGQSQGYLYIVMEYLPGKSLKEALDELRASKRWIELPEAVALIHQVALAAHAAHQEGVLHRDLKPANIVLSTRHEAEGELPYQPVITDLGLSHLAEGGVVTQEGVSMGTPAYMSPEHALGQPTTERSEVYSLGVLLYELATGRLPFPAQSFGEAVFYHTEKEPPAPRAIRPDLPEPLEVIILKALRKNPEQRFRNAAALAKALEAIGPAIQFADLKPVSPAGAVSLAALLSAPPATETVEPEERETQVQTQILDESDEDQDVIEIIQQDGVQRWRPFDKGALTVGRGRENDIILDDAGVSRHHARLERGERGYQVTDLDSANGSYIEGERLMPGVATPWPPGATLRLGRQRLRVMPAQATQPSPNRPPGTPPDATTQPYIPGQTTRRIGAGAAAGAVQPGSGRVSVYMENLQLSVKPGESLTTAILVVNGSASEERYRITIDGLPASWYSVSPRVLRLRPDEQQEVVLRLHPNRSPGSKAGRYAFTVQVSSRYEAQENAEVKAILTVGAFYDFETEFFPPRLVKGQRGRVTVTNQGNTQETYNVVYRSKDNELSFDPEWAQLRIPEGEAAMTEFQASPRHTRWFGSDQNVPFSVQINSTSGQDKTHHGELNNRALLPVWVLPVLFVMCLCLGASSWLIWANRFSPQARARATERAQNTQIAALMTGTAEVATATAISLENANQATIAAVTATASWLETDSDTDGLINARELELNTRPDVRDTDGDGLLDGEEVNVYNTNPLVPDTDTDSLNDGTEVARNMNPLAVDSDLDGTPDAFDLNPLSTPTPPPSPTITQTPPPSSTPPNTSTPTITSTSPPPATATNTATATSTPPNTATATSTATTAPAQVVGLNAVVDPASFSGVCPTTFTFTGEITTNGPTTVVYFWQRSDGSATQPQSLSFNAAGTQAVNNQWTLGTTGTHWAQLMVQQPNQTNSQQASFLLNCTQQATNVQFGQFPDGTPIQTSVLLNGNEFNAQGLNFESVPQPSVCQGQSQVAIRTEDLPGVSDNYLTTAQSGDLNLCNNLPVTVTFTSPVQGVSINFAGENANYGLQAYNEAGDLISQAQQPGNPGAVSQIQVAAPAATIKKIVFGAPGSRTAITRIQYTRP